MSKKFIVQKEQLSKKLLEEWQRLWDESSNVHLFNSPVWLQICEDYFQEEVTLITVRKQDKLYAVLLSSTQKWFGVSTLSCPSGRFMDKFSLLKKNGSKEMMKALINYLEEEGNFYLAEVNEKDKEIVARLADDVIIHESDINYYLPLEDSPLQYLSKKNASKIRNRIKNNEQYLSYKTFKGDEHSLAVAFRVDKASYKLKKGQATFVSEDTRKLFRTILRYLKDNFVIDVLYFKRKPIAFSIGFVYKETYLAINTSFDNEFQTLGPGKILAYLLIKRLHHEGFKTLDFGRGDSQLKQDFTPYYTRQYHIFYHQKQAALLWWKTADLLYSGLQENDWFYTAYCQMKKLWYR